MPRRTNDFQKLIKVIQSHLDPGAAVEESALLNDQLTGADREVDVCVRGRVAGQSAVISVECQDRGRRAGVNWVDEMKCKHSRLATDLLVLVSHSGFTKEANRIAEMYGIRCVTFEDIAQASPDRLFPDHESLWGKIWSLQIDRVDITVKASDILPARTVRAHPDTALFWEDGRSVGSAAEVANALLKCHPLQGKLGAHALAEHKFAEFGWKNPVFHGNLLCLQKLEPLVLRPVELFRVIAKCSVAVNDLSLRHGKYGAIRVAWGDITLLGTDMMVVATDDTAGELTVSMNASGGTPEKAG